MSELQPVVLGQIGAGYWGKNLLRNFARLRGVTVKTVCDVRESVRERVAASYPGIRVTADADSIFRDEEIDAVVVATETPMHASMSLSALAAGKHVLVEKPMAHTGSEALELVEAADERGLTLMVGHLLLHHPAFRFVEDLIRRGDLGEVYYLYSTRVNLGIVRKNENAFDSLAPHDLSVALRFLDRQPVAISAQGQAYLQPGVEDVAFATVYFEDGRIAHLHTSWLDPHKVRKVTVVGSRKMAVIDDTESSEKVRLYDKGVELGARDEPYATYSEAMSVRIGDISIPRIEMSEPLGLECQHFVDCVRTGQRPRTDGRDGLAVVRMLEAARESLQLGGASVEIG
jgi:predicted dehydrogenase